MYNTNVEKQAYKVGNNKNKMKVYQLIHFDYERKTLLNLYAYKYAYIKFLYLFMYMHFVFL